MKRPHLGTPNLVPTMWLAVCLAWACSDPATGSTAGPQGSPCAPTEQSEGCHAPDSGATERMRCAVNGQWALISVCPTSKACIEAVDLAHPSPLRRLTACGQFGAGGEGTPPVDSGSSKDGSARTHDAGGSQADTASNASAAIEVKIENVPATSYTFPYSDPAARQALHANVVIRNVGTAALVLTQLKWSTTNPKLSMAWVSSTPKFPMSFGPYQSISLRVTYQAWVPPYSQADASMTLTFAGGVVPDQTLTFHLSPPPPKSKPCAATPALTFVHPPAGKHTTGCVRLNNCGEGPLTFMGATVMAGGSVYSLASKPAAGTQLQAQGSEGNPADAPKGLEVCVKLYPDPSKGEAWHKGSLRVNTKDGDLDFPLAATWLQVPDMELRCGNGNNGFLLDFGGKNQELSCTLQLYSKQVVTFLSAGVEPIDPNDAVGVPQIYQLKASQVLPASAGGTKSPVLKFPTQLEPGVTLEIGAAYTAEGQSGVPDARLLLDWQLGDLEGRYSIDLRSGDCQTRHLEWTPTAVPVPLHGAVGKAVNVALRVANRGCGTLELGQACVMVGQQKMTEGVCAASNLSKVAAVQVSGLIGKLSIKDTVLGALNLYTTDVSKALPVTQTYLVSQWCPVGGGTATSCAKVWRLDNLPLPVSVGPAPDLPSPTPLVPAMAVVGRPTVLAVAPRNGPWPLASPKSYVWWLGKRPTASKSWIPIGQQTSLVPAMIFYADVWGTYQVYVSARFQDPKDATRTLWSEPVALSFQAGL